MTNRTAQTVNEFAGYTVEQLRKGVQDCRIFQQKAREAGNVSFTHTYTVMIDRMLDEYNDRKRKGQIT